MLDTNAEFIKKICSEEKGWLMQSKTKDFIVDLEAFAIQEQNNPQIFELYEEYSQNPIADTIRKCKENFDSGEPEARKERLALVEKEIKEFRVWLEESKKLEPSSAYYYSVGLKSLLLGLPIGVEMAKLFDAILDVKAKQ
jgi:hypothetical protein